MNLTHALIGVGVVGGVTVGSFLTSKYLFKSEAKTLKDRLVREKYKILNFEKDSEWTKVLEAYNKVKDSIDKRFTNSKGDIQLKDLKESCKSALEAEEIENSLFDKARKWCVVPRSISERLSDISLSPLKITDDTEENGDKSKWEKVSKQYETKGNNKISQLTLTTSTDGEWKKLRNKCKEFFAQDPWSENYDTNLKLSGDWCVKEVIKE